MTETAVENKIIWKRKAKYDPALCAVSGCKRPSDGYMTSVRKGRIWFGPICEKCSVSATSHKPTTLAELHSQRPDVVELAKALDMSTDETQELVNALVNAPVNAPASSSNGQVMDTSMVSLEDVVALTVANISSEIEAWTKQAEEVLAVLENFHIVDQQGLDLAGGLLQDVKIIWKTVEAARKQAGAPLRDQIKVIQAVYKPPQKLLEKAELILKHKINAAHRAQQVAQNNALAAAQRAYASGDVHGTALATQAAVGAAAQLPPGIHAKTQIRWEVLDMNQVPVEYLMTVINTAAVEAAIAQGVTEIPGLRVYEESNITARTA